MMMRRTTVLATLAGLAMTFGASTAAADELTLCERAYGVRTAVVEKHGKRAPGRNICRHGMRDGRRATTSQRARYLRALKQLNSPLPQLDAAGPPRVAPAGTLSPRVGNSHLAAIAACESGGNPGAVDPSGAYRGKYQFDRQTWASVGGSGDPAAAPEAEQDRRAAALYASRGAAPWPVCGK